jgi:hypothetical protein
VGEQWLDTSGSTYVFKIWDGSAWRSEAGEFVNVTGDVMTGALGIIAGSAASPGLYVSGDTNTGIYSPGSDQLALATGGTGRLFVDASGNVGLGVGSPQARLNAAISSGAGVATEVARFSGSANGANAGSLIRFTNTGAGTNPGPNQYNTGGIAAIDDTNNFGGTLVFYTPNSAVSGGDDLRERMRITSSGRLGLGTSSPQKPLEVAGAIRLSSDANSVLELGRFSSAYGGAAISCLDSSFLRFQFAGTDRMTLTSGGSLGIGVTEASALLHAAGTVRVGANDASTAELEIGAGATGNRNALIDFVGDTTYSDYGLRIIRESSGANANSVLYHRGTGALGFNAVDSAPILFVHNITERGRWDSNGRFLVGTSYARGFYNGTFQTGVQFETGRSLSVLSNDSDGGTGPAIVLAHQKSGSNGGHTAVANNDALGGISFQGSNGSNFLQGAEIGAFVDGAVSGGGALDLPTRLVFSVTRDSQSSPTEALRITNGGETRIFCVTTAQGLIINHSDTARNVYAFYEGRYSATDNTGSTGTRSYIVYTSGDVRNVNNSYGAISDIKLKENIVDANSQWDDLKALQVRNYNFKEGQTHTQIGLVAQEAELVSPGLVSESPDRDEDGNDLGTVTKSVNYSVLYMKAVKALQEAMERIEQLEQRLTDAGIA